MINVYIFAIPFFICWGSFLNFLAHRLISGQPLTATRSECPRCHHILAWYDLIPVLSWVTLRARCRYCAQPISWLYPFLELLTPFVLTLLLLNVPIYYIPAYFIFFSALLVTIRTDLEHMLISSFMTLFLVPFGIVLSAAHMLPISLNNSLAGAMLGYGFLWALARIFYRITGKHGMGEGDFELLCFIGAFTGIVGCWMSLLIGSVFGSIIGIAYSLLVQSDEQIKIPFGPFLAIGAIMYVVWQPYLLRLLIAL